MSAPLLEWLAPILVGISLGLLLRARLRLEKEKRRADAADSRSRSYFSVIEVLAHSMRGGGERSREQILEAAKQLGLPERDVAALGDGMGPNPPSPSGERLAAPVSDTRYLFVSFEEEIRRAAGRGEPLTLLTLEAGSPSSGKPSSDPAIADRLLRGVARAVRGQMRGCDTCIRYGAREFILILPGVSREEARKVEGRIRTAIQSVTIEPFPGIALPVHASLGSATYPDDGSGFDPLLTVADVRRSRDASPDLPGGPDQNSPVSLPWHPRPVNPN